MRRTAITTATLGAFGNAPSNSGLDALVPSSYSSWQLNDHFWLGMSVTAPFGLGVQLPAIVGGLRPSGESAKLDTYNFSPTVAYKFNDWISVAVGLQAQYMKVSYDAFVGASPLRIRQRSTAPAGVSAGPPA